MNPEEAAAFVRSVANVRPSPIGPGNDGGDAGTLRALVEEARSILAGKGATA